MSAPLWAATSRSRNGGPSRSWGNPILGLRVGDVARRTDATLQATSHLLRRLEDRGLLSLTRDENDRRATVAQLSPEGARLRAAVLAHRRELLAGMARDLDPSAPADEFLGELARRFAEYQR